LAVRFMTYCSDLKGFGKEAVAGRTYDGPDTEEILKNLRE